MKMLLCLALLLLLPACAEPRGTVIEKTHEDASSFLMLWPLTTCSGGKYTTCTTMLIPLWTRDDEDWILTLKDEEGKTHHAYVSEGIFNSVRKGDFLDCVQETPCETHDSHKKLPKGDLP